MDDYRIFKADSTDLEPEDDPKMNRGSVVKEKGGPDFRVVKGRICLKWPIKAVRSRDPEDSELSTLLRLSPLFGGQLEGRGSKQSYPTFVV